MLRYCPIEHQLDSYVPLVERWDEIIQTINGKKVTLQTHEWRCPVCDAEKIIRDYSET
jgi:hypothetical protein